MFSYFVSDNYQLRLLTLYIAVLVNCYTERCFQCSSTLFTSAKTNNILVNIKSRTIKCKSTADILQNDQVKLRFIKN